MRKEMLEEFKSKNAKDIETFLKEIGLKLHSWQFENGNMAFETQGKAWSWKWAFWGKEQY